MDNQQPSLSQRGRFNDYPVREQNSSEFERANILLDENIVYSFMKVKGKFNMWVNNGKVEKLVKSDIIPDGFSKGRLKKPKAIDSLIQIVSKEDLYKYYILENHSFLETVSFFNLDNRKHLILLLKYYNIHKDPKMVAKYTKRTRSHESYIEGGIKSSKTQKENWKSKSQIEKQDYSDKQKKAHSTDHFKELIRQININYQNNLSQEYKDYLNSRRSKTLKTLWIVKHDELLEQMRESRINNKKKVDKGICRTYQEQKIYNCLIQKYPDLIYDKKIDDRYPFYVDFYIPSLDLFIEYQGHPSHGKRPYNENNLEECYNLYGSWLDLYVNKDTAKYNIAIQNNINLIRIYPQISLQENYELNKFKFKDIIELIYKSIK